MVRSDPKEQREEPGHPHGETLGALEELGVAVLGMAEVGSVAVEVVDNKFMFFSTR